jgi:hypothetical protein
LQQEELNSREKKRYEEILKERETSLDKDVLDKLRWGLKLNVDEENRYTIYKWKQQRAYHDNEIMDKVRWGMSLSDDEKTRYEAIRGTYISDNTSMNNKTRWDDDAHQVTPSEDKFDTGLYDRRQAYLQKSVSVYGQHKEILDPKAFHAMRLLKIMDDHGCPRVMYEKLTKWCMDVMTQNPYGVPTSFPTRNNLFDYLADRYGLHGLIPTSVRTQLPCHNIMVDVTTFDFQEMCMSLLTHPDLALDDNWAFPDPKNPLVPPKMWDDVLNNQQDCILSDIQHAEWYSKTYYTSCTVQGRDVLLPVILFVDKTHTDAVGRLKQEPVMFTLGCFDLKTRSNPDAWRPLGYIPNMETLQLSDNPRMKLQDYHHMLSTVLKSLVETQRAGGFKWSVYAGKNTTMLFFVVKYLFFVATMKV